MSRFIGESNTSDILNVAEEFKQKCLLGGKSLFSNESVWQLQYLEELKTLYVDNELLDNRDFFEKLKEQLSDSSPQAVLLAAEVYWFMMLCPRGSISSSTKVSNINKILSINKHVFLPYKDNYLSEKYMIGVGSPGTAFFTQIWKEFKFAILFFLTLFEQKDTTEKSILSSNTLLTESLCTIEKKSNPQLRYMVLYLFFPDENERVFSNTGREQILSTLANISSKEYNTLSLLQINNKLFEVRKRLEQEYNTTDIDFYIEPYKELWANLEKEFKTWVKSQIKSNKTGYSDNSMKPRYKALKEGVSKLNIETKIKYSNIFNYTDLEDFSADAKKICNADNFIEINKKYGNGGFSAVLRQYRKFLRQRHPDDNNKNEGTTMPPNLKFPKNQILYGPPGTGKTYSSVIYALAIIEGKSLEELNEEAKNNFESLHKRFKELKASKQIETITFHQSYGYEEFIEGIKPVMTQDFEEEGNSANIQYEISSGIFKSFCERADSSIIKKENAFSFGESATIWKVSLGGTGENPIRSDCFNNSYIRIGFSEYGENIADETIFIRGKNVVNAFLFKMKKGDIVLSCYSNTTIDAIGIVTGEYEWKEELGEYKRTRSVNWLVKNIRKNIVEMNNNKVMTQSTVYKLSINQKDIIKILSDEQIDSSAQIQKNDKNYVFIIDEINRGNISKIFGELITLIEEAKRLGADEETTVKLPYSLKPFGVPNNVYILGTMNTADRSIARLDTALHRRFHFIEMLPDANILEGITVEGINIKEIFTKINKRITILYDREHTIGHSYFLPLKKELTLKKLASIFRHTIIPLLQEYFYDDYEKIRLVLGDSNKENKEIQFVIASINEAKELFPNYDYEEQQSYEINDNAFDNIESYLSI